MNSEHNPASDVNQGGDPWNLAHGAWVSPKHTTASVLSLLLGWLGIDRFYMGRIGLGILKLVVSVITFGGGAFVWGIVDYILITSGKAIDGNGKPLIQY